MKVERLGDVALVDRRSVDPTRIDPNTRYLGLEHLERGGRILGHDTVGRAALASSKFSFTAQHLLYSKLRPNLGKISRPTFSGVCSTDILPILPGPRLDRDYLAHFLAQTRMIEFAASRAAGANLPRLSPTALKEFEIPLPPVEEQRRIAAILNQADAMRTQRRHLLAQMNSLSQSVFMSMFGDPANAGDTVSLGEIASLTGGRNLVAEDLSAETPYRVLKISSVTSGQFRPSESKPLPSNYQPPAAHFVREGDLLMSRANTSELVGAVAYVSQVADNLVLPDKIWRFEWRDTASNPTFYRILLQTPTIRRRISRMSSGTGGSMKNVSKAKLATLRLPAVSPTAQRKFAAHVDRIELQRAKVEHALALEDELFAALQLRAFQGQL